MSDNAQQTITDLREGSLEYEAAQMLLEQQSGQVPQHQVPQVEDEAEPLETEDEEPEAEELEVPEAEGDEDDDTVPKLDIDNDEAQAIWERQWKGIQKRERKLKESEALLNEYAAAKPRYEQLATIERALEDPSQFRTVIRNLTDAVAKMHGVNVAELYGETTPIQADNSPDDFEFPDDRKVYERAKQDAIKEMRSELQQMFGDLDLNAVREQQQKTKAEAQFDARLTEVLPTLSRKLESTLGIKFSKAQIAEALKENPEVSDPEKAVKLHYMDLIERQRAKRLAKSQPKAPELIKESSKVGKAVTSNSRYGLADALSDMGITH